MPQPEASTAPAQNRIIFDAVRLLHVLGNERRLRVLYCLSSSKHAELNVTELAARSGLAQSALSQHLAKMRACGMVAVRRSGQRRFYQIAGSEELWRALAALCEYVRLLNPDD
jgi:ArsR family transcriptional regulator, virulence genes transcriptional regulator